MIINLPSASHDEQNSDQIEAKVNEKYVFGKMLYFLDLGHYLRNPKKKAYSGQHEQNAPDEVQCGFWFIFHNKSAGVLE
jgi:hypothetical protein